MEMSIPCSVCTEISENGDLWPHSANFIIYKGDGDLSLQVIIGLCTGIRAVGKGSNTGNVFAVDRKLDIVGRFQLAVPHVVFFHPHECGVLVGFGHTSAVISNGEQLVLVLCPFRPQAVQLFIPLLPFALALSDPMNKFCIWRKLLVRQLLQFLSGQIAFSTASFALPLRNRANEE